MINDEALERHNQNHSPNAPPLRTSDSDPSCSGSDPEFNMSTSSSAIATTNTSISPPSLEQSPLPSSDNIKHQSQDLNKQSSSVSDHQNAQSEFNHVCFNSTVNIIPNPGESNSSDEDESTLARRAGSRGRKKNRKMRIATKKYSLPLNLNSASLLNLSHPNSSSLSLSSCPGEFESVRSILRRTKLEIEEDEQFIPATPRELKLVLPSITRKPSRKTLKLEEEDRLRRWRESPGAGKSSLKSPSSCKSPFKRAINSPKSPVRPLSATAALIQSSTEATLNSVPSLEAPIRLKREVPWNRDDDENHEFGRDAAPKLPPIQKISSPHPTRDLDDQSPDSPCKEFAPHFPSIKKITSPHPTRDPTVELDRPWNSPVKESYNKLRSSETPIARKASPPPKARPWSWFSQKLSSSKNAFKLSLITTFKRNRNSVEGGRNPLGRLPSASFSEPCLVTEESPVSCSRSPPTSPKWPMSRLSMAASSVPHLPLHIQDREGETQEEKRNLNERDEHDGNEVEDRFDPDSAFKPQQPNPSLMRLSSDDFRGRSREKKGVRTVALRKCCQECYKAASLGLQPDHEIVFSSGALKQFQTNCWLVEGTMEKKSSSKQ